MNFVWWTCHIIMNRWKFFQCKFSLRSWVTNATKVPHFCSFFILCQVWPKISHKPFDIFSIKFSKVKDNCISNNSSKYEQKLSRNKTVVRFENFEKFATRARNTTVNFGGPPPLTFESHNVDNVIFSIFGKVTSIPEILGLFTNIVSLSVIRLSTWPNMNKLFSPG